jgi:hypothetical protein
MERSVYVESGNIISETIEEIDNSEKGGGKLVRRVIFEMDKEEAARQMMWVEAGIKQAQEEIKRCRIAMSPEGRKTMIHLERQKLHRAQKDLEEFQKHKEEYEKALKGL